MNNSMVKWILIGHTLLVSAWGMSPGQPAAKVVSSNGSHFFVMTPIDKGKQTQGKCYKVMLDGRFELNWQVNWGGERSQVYLDYDGKYLAREIWESGKNDITAKIQKLEFYRDGKLVKRYSVGEIVKCTYENGESVESKFEIGDGNGLDVDSIKSRPEIINPTDFLLLLDDVKAKRIQNIIQLKVGGGSGWVLRYPLDHGKQMYFLMDTGDMVYFSE